MNIGDPVRIHYPEKPIHNLTGTVERLRRVGQRDQMYEIMVKLHRPWKPPKGKVAQEVIGPLIKARVKPAERPEAVIEWRGAMPEPTPIEWEEGEAEPIVHVVRARYRTVKLPKKSIEVPGGRWTAPGEALL